MKKNAVKQLTWVAAMLALMMVAVSCNRATRFAADVAEIKAEMTGAKGTIGLHSDATGFELTHSPEWVVASIADSTLTYSMGTNDTKAVRRDSIVVSCGGMSLVIPVEQVVKATKLSVNPEKVEFEKEGGKAEVAVDTDGASVKVDCPEGVTATYVGGKLDITVPRNGGGIKNYTIILTSDELSAKVYVSVKSATCPRCKGKGKITCPTCHGLAEVYSPKYNTEILCKTCTGAEWDVPSASSLAERAYMRGVITGKITCPDCKGTGTAR